MAEDTARKFVEALGKLEAERDLETIVSLFSENCEIGNVVTENKDKKISPREFWQNYRDNFSEVKSTFQNQIITENCAALEWTTAGTSTEGKDFQYDGVSVLEIEGDKIARFHAYFDPNKLGQQIVSEKTRSA
ncbi:MAG TPA: nuclear transport factor 2 family protein [Pyrinomonadaceae bacterium]|nr:nuclear transport factor 2 family protein [Pyrinomonadaceae bacterium]